MIWTTTILTFVASTLAVLAAFYALSARAQPAADRLSRLWSPAAIRERLREGRRAGEQLSRALGKVGQLIPVSPQGMQRAERIMQRAGFRRPEVFWAYQGAKVLLPGMLLAAVYLTGFYRLNPVLVLVSAGFGGFLLPEIWLTRRVRLRQRKIQRGLADALDLLVVCVEAGLALDQAMLRVAQELFLVHPDLSEEMQIVNLEIRMGQSRPEALRNFATRTGVEDIQALVSILTQTDRFGTSVAQSLRVYSDNLRTKRRQRAEELAAKATVKMIPILVLFIFPALFVVILGPAVINLIRQLLPALK